MDAATRASLEIHRARDGGTQHTLLGAVQRTLTAGGRAAAGRAWLAAPLTDPAAIAARQDAWVWLLANPEAAHAAARGVAERARHGARAGPAVARARRPARPRGAARRHWPRAASGGRGDRWTAAAARAARAKRASRAGDPAPRTLRAQLGAALADPGAASPGRRHAIRPGFDAELDAERALRDDSRRVLATLQLDYAQRYGVASLKIRHHAQLGYVIEVPAAAVEKLRDHSPN